jgi:trans-aconitate methyltransferase
MDSLNKEKSPKHDWQPSLYDGKHSFVWKFGSSVVELLAPQAGERILDLGCGTGQLMAEIAEAGVEVIGMDNSPEMIAEARRLYPQFPFQQADAHDFETDEPFDAVFSNAVLHWITEPGKVVKCIARSLKQNGRMVVEFGGHGNVRHLSEAIETACNSILGETVSHPWYFPGIAEFSSLLEQHGLEVTQAALIDRPTPLEGDEGLRNWVRMFGSHWLNRIPENRQNEFFQHIEDSARSTLLRESIWHADYRRLRVVAIKNDA